MARTRKHIRLSWAQTAFLMVFGLVLAINIVGFTGRVIRSVVQPTVLLEAGEMERRLSGQAVFFSREQVLVAPSPGRWEPEIDPGSQVLAGDLVGHVIVPELWQEAQLTLAQLQRQKDDWYRELKGQQQLVRLELNALDEDLAAVLMKIRQKDVQRTQQQLEKLKGTLNQLLKNRQDLLNKRELLADKEGSREPWDDQEQQAVQQAQKAKEPVYSPLTGRFLCSVDGLEQAYDPVQQPSALLAMSQSSIPPEVKTAIDGSIVSEGQALGKVMQTDLCLARISICESDFLPELNEQVRLVFTSSGHECQAQVVAGGHFGSEAIVIVRLDSWPRSLAKRCSDVEIVSACVQGVLVPRTAVVHKEQGPGVFCSRDDDWHFVPIDIVAEDRNYLLAVGPQPGDNVACGSWTRFGSDQFAD